MQEKTLGSQVGSLAAEGEDKIEGAEGGEGGEDSGNEREEGRNQSRR